MFSKMSDHQEMHRFIRLGLALGIASLAGKAVCGQLPKSGTLSPQDERPFRAEVSRLERLLETAADKATVDYALARTWAAGQQWPEAIQWLRRLDPKSGIDPWKDRIFASLRGTVEFEEVVKSIRDAASQVANSRQAFRVAEGDLTPESVAYDPGAKMFYFGSLRKGKVVRCSPRGVCGDFLTGMGTILGLKVHGRDLWLLNNSDQESDVMIYELKTGHLVGKHPVGAGHLLNDLVISPSGEAFFTDTRVGAIWRLALGAKELELLPGQFEFANGVAISSGANRLYVSTFPDGITVLDLRTRTASALQRPAGLCLANVDGLYFYHRDLIAIQNGIMAPRVIRIVLARDEKSAARFDVLESGNPLFDGVTTGVVVGKSFYYMANIQDDRTTDFRPISVLALPL